LGCNCFSLSLTMFLLAFKFMLDFAENNRHLILSCCFACAAPCALPEDSEWRPRAVLVLYWPEDVTRSPAAMGLAAVLLAPGCYHRRHY
jgi:hypothetical protein